MPGAAEEALFGEAFDLAIALQDGATPERLAAAREWRARSGAHAAVWARVAEIHGMTGRVLADQRRAERRLTRRGLIGGAALVLGAAGAWRFGPPLAARLRADAVTGTAEVRALALPDGSAAVLGPETALTLDFTPRRRRVGLDGMGYFEVASDRRAPPFAVTTPEGARAETGDAAFEVSGEGGVVTIAVARGEVTLGGGSLSLAGGESARITDGGASLLRGRSAAGIADWRGGVAVAEDETVASLVARIGRWRSGPVLVTPGIAGRSVSGVFDLTAPDAALDAVVRPLGGRVRRMGPVALVSAG